MKKAKIYDVKEFKTIKEIFEYSGKEFAKRDAFLVKHKDGKNINYEHITFERLQNEVNALGTAMIDRGYKGKKIAIIGKNRYEWVLTFGATLGGVRNSSST